MPRHGAVHKTKYRILPALAIHDVAAQPTDQPVIAVTTEQLIIATITK